MLRLPWANVQRLTYLCGRLCVCVLQMVWLFVLARFTNRYMSAEEVRCADMRGLGSGLGGRVVAPHSSGAGRG